MKGKSGFGDPWLWIGCALYAIVLTWLGWVKYETHHNLVDFGIFTQTAASAFGCFCNGPEGSHWAFHFSPILYLPGALLLIWNSPLVMIALPAIACALVAPPVYAIVRARTDIGAARLAGLVALLYPPLAGLAFVDFHENAFAPAAIAWLLWAFDVGYLGVAAIAALAALAVKEDQAIFLAVAGGFGAWLYRADTRRARFALGVAIAGVAALVAFFVLIQPHANASPTWLPDRFYAWTGDDVHALFFGGILSRLGFFALAFAPLAFVPFRSRWMWLAALPLAEVLFSRMSTTFTMGTHYAGAWAGYVLIAFAFGIAVLPKPRRALWWALALTLVVFVAANPLHPGLNLRAVEPRDRELDAYLLTLPPNLSVSTQEEVYTHLALTNPGATLFPESPTIPVMTCDVIVDFAFPESPRLVEYAPALRLRSAGIVRSRCRNDVDWVPGPPT
ncbi:MAG: DUF2079 domain-containing protein [Candidatus Eremiobacteraeota bacterium]|nr:DUF2079 domain-containing protein [Candidatus Eremiobacteraeota bacterium]